MALSLHIIAPAGERRITVREAAVVGREPSCDLPLDDPLVSRRHIRLLPDGAGFAVEDLGSRNGATRNGTRIRGPEPLQAGDRIELGRCTLVVEAMGPVNERGTPSPRGARKKEGAERERADEGDANEALAGGASFRLPRLAAGRKGPFLAAALFLVLALAWSLGGSGGAGAGHAVWPLDEEAAGLVFGWGHEAEFASPASLDFEWQPASNPRASLLSLRYETLHEAGTDGLELRLNGTPIAAVGGSGLGWTEEEWPLPRQLLREGVPNRISFVHLGNEKGAREAWLVSGIALKEEALPNCEAERCLQAAAERLEQGEIHFARRQIDPRNLLHARSAFRQGLLYLEALDPKPDLYGVTRERLREADEALGRRCRDMRFRVIRHIAYGDEPAAGEEAARMARFFSEDDHPCHRSAMRFLQMLE